MSEVEKAVNVLLDPSASQSIKQAALSFLQSLKANPAFYKEIISLLSSPSLSSPLSILFFYLQTLEEYAQTAYGKAGEAEKREMREFLEGTLRSHSEWVAGEISLMHKFALIYARVVIQDFPHMWPSAISTLVSLYPLSRFYALLVLSVFQMVHEEAIDNETRSPSVDFSRAKQLRGIVKELALPLIIPIWQSELAAPSTDLTQPTLVVCGRYIELMSLQTVVPLLPVIIAHMGEFQIPVLQCVQSLVRKVMPTEQKIALIRDLGIIPYIQQIDFQSIDNEGSDLIKALASVINAIGVQLVDCRDRTAIWDVLSLAFTVFGSCQPLVSRGVFEFFRVFAHSLKIKTEMTPPEAISQQELDAVGRICMALMERAKIPCGFSWKSPENSDEEDQFYTFREDLSELFKDIMKLETTKSPILDLIAGRLIAALGASDTSSEVYEALLFLLFHFSDCLTDLHQILTSDSPLSHILRIVLTSALPSHPNPLVQRTLFDLGVRLASFFDSGQNEQLLGVLVTPLLRMMLSGDPEASSFAVKRVIGLVIKAQRPMMRYAQEVFETAEKVIDAGALDPPALFKLFKALGLLLGNPTLSDQFKFKQTHHLSQVLLINCTPSKLQQLSELLSGIGRRGNAEFQSNLLSLFSYIAERLTSAALSSDSYDAVASLTYRFAICLESCSAPVCEQVLHHMSQFVSIDTVDCLMKLISNLAQNCLSAITDKPLATITAILVREVQPPTETVSDLAQDIIAHRRNYIKMLEALATKGMDLLAVSCFAELVEYVRGIVSNPCEAIVSTTQSGKIAIVIFSKLLYFAATSPSSHPHTTLLLDRALEAASIILYSPAMRYLTGETSVVLQEISNVHRLGFLLAQRNNVSEEFFRYLEKETVGSAGKHREKVIAKGSLEEYTHLVKATKQYSLGDPESLVHASGHLNALKTLLVRMLELTPR